MKTPTKEQMFSEWFQEYTASWELSKTFGWNFDERSKDLIQAINTTAASLGFTPDELAAWIEKQPRETALGTIPVPSFTAA